MNDQPEDVILSLYTDYHHWCRTIGIPPERYEEFYNIVSKYDPPTLQHIVRDMFSPYDIPLQPNDEQRAVAEVMRMLGGAT